MKKYRLKKDTFLAKKGELFKEVNESGAVYLQRIKPDGSDLFTKIAKAPIIDFDEWFEEVREFEEWKPKESEQYKHTVFNGMVGISTYYGEPASHYLLSIGNCYPIDTPDEVIIKEQKLIPQAMHRLKMAAKKAWFEFDGSEGPDWSDKNQEKYFIEFSHKSGSFYFSLNGFCQSLGQIYFPTEESAEYVIDNMQDDLKLLFGVE